MQIIIKATDEQLEQFVSKLPQEQHTIIPYKKNADPIPTGDLYVDFQFEAEGPAFITVQDKTVLVNAVLTPSNEMPPNFVRFNGWTGFIERSPLEIAGHATAVQQAHEQLSAAGIAAMVSADTIGMIAPRVVAMIINEAYFALSENVSSKEDIDTAMKLGTNYPFGPFEWCEKIGINQVAKLLAALQHTNERYSIAPALKTT